MSLVQSEINRLGYTIEQQRNIITMVSTERDNAWNAISVLQSNNDALQINNDALQSNNDALQSSNDALQKQIDEYLNRYGKLD